MRVTNQDSCAGDGRGLGQVRLERVLGSLGPITRWRGECGNNGSTVSVLTVDSRRAWASAQVARSVDLLASIEHPALNTPRARVETDRGTAYAGPWRETTSLIEWARLGAADVSEVWDRFLPVFHSLLDLLERVHQAGLVLCGPSLRSVVVDSDGNGLVQSAPLVSRAGETLSLIQAREFFGLSATPPELLRGRPVQPATDLYLLGILTHTLLLGRRPHRGSSTSEVCRSILHRPWRAESERRLPPGVGPLLECLLSVQPEARPSDATALRRALDAPGGVFEPPTPDRPQDEDQVESWFLGRLPTWIAGPGRTVVLTGGDAMTRTRMLRRLAGSSARAGLTVELGAADNQSHERGFRWKQPYAPGLTELRPALGEHPPARREDYTPRVILLDRLDEVAGNGLWTLQQLGTLRKQRLPLVLVLAVEDPGFLDAALAELVPSVVRLEDPPDPFEELATTGTFVLDELRRAGREGDADSLLSELDDLFGQDMEWGPMDESVLSLPPLFDERMTEPDE